MGDGLPLPAARGRRRQGPRAWVERLWNGPAAADGDSEAPGAISSFWQNARAIARARLLLTLGNALVIYLDPSLPTSMAWPVRAATYGNVVLMIAYSLWALWQESAPHPPPSVPRLTTWLDVVFSAMLIAVTGAHKSPFYVWNTFTLVAVALKSDRQSLIRVYLTQIAIYVAICLPNLSHPDFAIGIFLVRTAYMFVIAMVLALMGQRLLEQNRMLVGLQTAAMHMSLGHSPADILGRVVDSLTDLLEVEQAAAALGEEAAGDGDEAGRARPGLPEARLVNLDRAQGEALLSLAREQLMAAPPSARPVTLVSHDVARDARFAALGPARAGVRNLLLIRLPGRTGGAGVLIACNRAAPGGFTATQQELAKLLAVQAGALLETARLQAQRRYHAGVDERRRIAGELHDRLIQTLASIDLRALTCQETWRAGAWPALGEELETVKRLAEEALEEARGAISELAPVRLREEGLSVYLEDCLHQFQERVATPVTATIALGEAAVPEPTALLLIGLLREGLNNIRKHARATGVQLEIAQHADRIQFRLADDGVGMAEAAHPQLLRVTRQYGLAYLRERLAQMGGELQVTSRPGAGTVLAARVPLLTEERLVALLCQEA